MSDLFICQSTASYKKNPQQPWENNTHRGVCTRAMDFYRVNQKQEKYHLFIR